MKKHIFIIIALLFFIQTTAQEEEKMVNYFIGLQVKYNNDLTGKTNNSQFDNYTNYTNNTIFCFAVKKNNFA